MFTQTLSSSSPPPQQQQASKKPRTGVADYFAILGVGDQLVWKHTQKQNIYGVDNNNDDAQESNDHANEEEEDAAVEYGANEEEAEERFLREVVDVAILGLDNTGNSSTTSAALNDDSFLLGTSMSCASEGSGSNSHHPLIPPSLSQAAAASSSTDLSDLKQSHLSAVVTTTKVPLHPPNSPVYSETTETTISRHSALHHQHDKFKNAAAADLETSTNVVTIMEEQQLCWTAIQKTLPAASAGYVPILAVENDLEDDDTMNENGAGGDDTDSHHHTASVAHRGPLLWKKQQVWDANLSWNFGLRSLVHAHRQKVLRAVTVNPSAPSLKGMIPSKIQSKLKQVMWKGSKGNDQDDQDLFLANQQQKFVLAYRRRFQSSFSSSDSCSSTAKETNPNEGDDGSSPQQISGAVTTRTTSTILDNRPGIADLRLFYVRLHRNLLVSPRQGTEVTLSDTINNNKHGADGALDETQSNATSTTNEKKSTGGLSSLLLEGVFQSQAKHFSMLSSGKSSSLDKNTNRTSNTTSQATLGPENHTTETQPSQPSSSLVSVEEYLNVPEGFEEWCIPQDYRLIRDPRLAAEEEHQQLAAKARLQQQQQQSPTEKTGASTRMTLLGKHFRTKVLFPQSNQPSSSANSDENHSSDATAGVGVVTGSANAGIEVAAMSISPSPSTVTSNGGGSVSGAIEPTAPIMPTTIPLESLLPELVTQPPHKVEEETLANYCYIPIIACRRQRIGDEERYHEDPAIVEMAVSFMDVQGRPVMPSTEENYNFDEDDGADDDEGGAFSVLGKTSWTVAGRHPMSKKPTARRLRRQFGSPAILVRRNRPFGFADAAFATRVLDRFPQRNYKGLPLPQEELPMFCYPTGCRLFRARYSDAPLAQYYGFVVKNERGDSIYVSCVSFMEPLTTRKVEQLARISEKRKRTSLPHQKFCEKRDRQRQRQNNPKIKGMGTVGETASDCSTEADSNFLLTGFDDMTTFENKTICLVSRSPFWTAFRKFLSHLHILSGSVSDIPLERCISHLLLSVPLPRPGGHNVIVPLPTLNTSTEPMMVLSVPPEKDFPLVDLPYHRLVACLEINTIVMIVLGMLALEKKVIVLSTRPCLVLDVCELMRSLLFPFELCAPYVPRLTEPFQSSLDFPGAIFVGIHDDGSPHGLAATVRREIPEDAIVVDLETGEVESDRNMDRAAVLETSWDILPRGPRIELVKELQALCDDAEIVDGQEPLDSQYDSAFEVSLPNAVDGDGMVGHDAEKTPEPLDDRAFRDAFLRFYCKVLGGYERFLVVPDADFLVSGNEWFDSQGFLASVTARSSSEQRAPYLAALVGTQLFQSFIQRRTEASDVHCLLFDECMEEYHASPKPYGRLGDDMEKIQEEENGSPRVVYSLLVDQSAALPAGYDQQSFVSDKSFDASETDHSGGNTANALKASHSFADSTSAYSKYAESMLNPAGDLVTGPSRENLQHGQRYIYCIDGNPCFPHKFNESLFFPKEPESWLVEMSKTPDPLLARSEKEMEEADRRRRLATSHCGFQKQNRRCLWQLPKLMGSHLLGAWLLCIPAQVSQHGLSHEQQSRYLMRALGALRLLRSKQRIVPDEAAYRALMVACGRSRSDRRTELVKLFGLLRSDGIFPSAVTLGQYTRALAEGYSKQLLGSSGGSGGGNSNQENHNLDDGEANVGLEDASEFAGRTGRISIGIASERGGAGWDAVLNSTDGHLSALEQQGRRWRNKQHGSSEQDDGGKDHEGKKKRSSRSSWLPVVYSSSFVPIAANSTTATRVNNKTPPPVKVVAIWSKTRACRNCCYIPLEEEVQAGWDVIGGDDESSGAICCPRCGSLFVPMLGVKEFSLDEARALGETRGDNGAMNSRFDSVPSSVADFELLPPQISPRLATTDDLSTESAKKIHFVAYKSPAAVRVALEQYVEESGGDDTILARERLRERDPELFYNFWWFCARFALPLPLSVFHAPDDVNGGGSGEVPAHCVLFGAWDQAIAERACFSAAQVLSPLFEELTLTGKSNEDFLDPFDDHPLLSRFNLQGFYSNVWDHKELSKILVCLVEACDKRDFKPVVECVLENNEKRKRKFGGLREVDSTSSSGRAHDARLTGEEDGIAVDLEVYRTILYLAKYQCTTAFHAFFPATIKPCKGYHFWCAIGQPLPIFDRLLRDGVQRVAKTRSGGVRSGAGAPTTPSIVKDVSDIALGFRCVFGHLI